MTLPRIIRPRGTPADPDAIDLAPRWLQECRRDLGDVVASVGGREPYVDSAMTLALAIASIERDDLPVPLVLADAVGGVSAQWRCQHGEINLACKGRLAVVSAWQWLSTRPAAFKVRDELGVVVPGVGQPEATIPRLRLGLAWAMGDASGVPECVVLRDAACGRKRIG